MKIGAVFIVYHSILSYISPNHDNVDQIFEKLLDFLFFSSNKVSFTSLIFDIPNFILKKNKFEVMLLR